MAEVTPGIVTPEVVQPVAAPEATPAPEIPADQVSDPPQEAEPVKPEKTYSQKEYEEAISKRLAKESRRLERVARAEAEAAHYKRLLEEKTQAPQPKQGEPKVEDYQDVREFVKDFTAWQLKEQRASQEKESASQHEQRAQTERAQFVHRQLIAPGIAKFADFQDVVLADDVPVTQVMVAAASRLKNGAEVLYRLCQDREEVARIADLPDIEQAWEIKSYESKISAPPAPTKTPPPIVPNGSKATVDKDPSKMSDKEFNEWRRRQIAQRGSR